MKKIIFLTVGIMLSLSLWGQRTFTETWSKSIEPSAISGSDTVIYKCNLSGYSFYLEAEYHDLDANDATLDVGLSIDGNTFNSFGGDNLPKTLNVGSDSTDVNGTQRTTVGYLHTRPIPLGNDGCFAIKCTPGSVTSGYVDIVVVFIKP